MTLIREAGELVAVVGRTRAYLLRHVEHLPEADQLRRRALAKCLFALAIATGRRPGPYRELEAQAFACHFWSAAAGYTQMLWMGLKMKAAYLPG